MQVVIEHGGQCHAVEVTQRPDGGIVVSIDGVAAELDVRCLQDGTFGVRLADGATHVIGVERGSTPDQRVVSIDGQRIVTALNGRRGRRAAAHGGAGLQHIMAPMPGKIVRVLTAVGADVDARQPLVVVEAMKMENELFVSRAGRVVEVVVTEGQSVEAGRLLVVVE